VRERWKAAWPHIRATLVLAHVAGVLLLALPSLRAALDRSAFHDPTVQAELEAWALRFRSLGFDAGAGELEERAYGIAVAWARTRETLVAPFEPYRRYVGIRQPWVMFVAPQRYPARVEVEIEEAGRWRTIFRERSAEHAWRRELFDHDRLRAALFRYAWDAYGATYRELAEWIGTEVAKDFPSADRVRVRMFRFRTPSPEEASAGAAVEGTYEREIVLGARR
jgi:hypothetical protein